MTAYSIPPSAIEAAQAAGLQVQLEVAHGSGMSEAEGRSFAMEAALRAAFDELGMERENEGLEEGIGRVRLVSRWMPVEEPQ